jgi:hypothetical protein
MDSAVYIVMDQKPENGCKIQNSACGQIGIMMQLNFVKTMLDAENAHLQLVDDGLLHRTVMLKSLVLPCWARIDRIVLCADSYFASAGDLQELKHNGLRFIGVVKTPTQQYLLIVGEATQNYD